MDRWDIPIREEPDKVSERLTVDEVEIKPGDPLGLGFRLTSNKTTFVNRDGVVKVEELEDSE